MKGKRNTLLLRTAAGGWQFGDAVEYGDGLGGLI